MNSITGRAPNNPINNRFVGLIRVLFVLIATTLISVWIKQIDPLITNELLFYYTLVGFIASAAFVYAESQIRDIFPQDLFIGLIGLMCGLSTSALLSTALPESWDAQIRDASRMSIHAFLGYFGTIIALRYAHRFDFTAMKLLKQSEDRLYGGKFVDTSILIDGRIIEIVEAGFVEGLLLIPNFVVNELQTLSDSEDHIKRSKGRRGLDISKRLQTTLKCEVETLEEDFPNLQGVDQKLLAICKKYQGVLLTMDFNLHKVAEIEEIRVLNLNQLAQSLKTIVLPGEEITIQILREGKEANQGVGYLDDGTMVVVDHGKQRIGQTVTVTVGSVLQTSAGRMVFTRISPQEKTA